MQTTLRQQLEKLKSGSLNRNEQKQILALFHRQEEEYAVKDEIYRQLESFADADTDPLKINAEFERLWKRLGVNNLEKRPRLINWTMVVNASAAMLILGLIIGNLVPVNSFRRNEKVFYTAIAPQGAVSETILPDSTVIFLNAGSKVRYAAGTEDLSREVYLDGEAWFAVKHSKKTPFIVHTGFSKKVLCRLSRPAR